MGTRMARPRIKKIGEWNRTGKLLRLASPKLRQESVQAADRAAKIYYEKVMEVLRTGLPSWPRLTDDWRNKKAKKGYDSRIYHGRGEFKNQIGISGIRGKYGGQSRFVGASPYKIHRSNLPLDILAKILQEKYNRPLFGPAWERAKGDIEKTLKEAGVKIMR